MTEVSTSFTTANIRNSLPAIKARADYDAARVGSDILCTQEMNLRDASAFVPTGWGTAQFQRSGSRARTAIHWREDRFRQVSWGAPLLHVSKLFKSATRYYTWVRLKDLETGRYWTIVNVHLVPHADDAHGGLTPLPRRRLVVRALTVLLTFAEMVRGQLVVTGDFNTDLRADLQHHDPDAVVEQFATRNLVSSAKILGTPPATHGRNLYDQMYFRVRRGTPFRLISQRVHPKGFSDHQAYTVSVVVTARRRWRS